MPQILIFISLFFSLLNTNALAIELERVFTITASAENGGKILPKGEVNVFVGRNQAFVITSDDGFEIAYLVIDGKINKPASTYAFKDVSENHSIKAFFRKKEVYYIKPVAGENGTISPSEVVEVFEYSNQQFKIVPNDGYSIDKLRIDGVEVKPELDYTFWDVAESHLISVTFMKLRKFIIIAEADDGGEIIPSGKINVEEHRDQSFRINSKIGYMIKDVMVDNKTIGPKNNFTFRDVKEAHIIRVQFMEERIVRGRVFDSDTKEGIEDSILEAWSYKEHKILGIAKSDASGRYTLTNMPPIGDLVIRCNPPSDMPLIKREDNLTPDGDEPKPLDGGETQPPDGDEKSTTDGENPPPDESIDVKKEVMPIRQSKYPSQYYKNKSSIDEADILNIEDNNLDQINFELKSYANIGFRGRVHDGNDGVENVMVNAFSAKHGFTKFAITDEFGDYTINYLVPSDDYIVTAEFPDLKMRVYFSLSRDKTIGVDSPTSSALLPNFASMITPKNPYLENIDILFDPGAEISGHVYDSNGLPLSNVRMNAWSPLLKRGNSASTDKTGAYTIKGLTEVLGIKARISGYVVEAWPRDYPYQVYDQASDPKKATLVATGKTDIDFYLSSGFSISGQVRPTYGSPLKNVKVEVYSPEQKIQRKTLTDESGFYTFTGLMPAKDYIVAAYAPNYPVQFYKEQSSSKMANPVYLLYQDAQNIDFILDRGAIIQGQVKVEGIQGRLPPAMIHIWSFSTQSGGDVRVDMDGSFMMVGLDENISDYMIMAKSHDYPTAYFSDNGDDNPENDTVYERNLAKGVKPSDDERILILSPGYTISGTLLAENVMIPRIRVKAWSEQTCIAKLTYARMMMGKYTYSFKGMAKGTYKVFVDEHAYTSEQEIVTIDEKDVTEVDLTLKEIQGNEISGFIYNLPQDETVSIHTWSLSMQSGKKIRVKGMGKAVRYRIKGLIPASDYRIELISDRYPTQIYDEKLDIKNATLLDLKNSDVTDIDFTIDQSTDSIVITGIVSFPEIAQVGETVLINAHSIKKRMSISTEITLGAFNPVPYTINGLSQSQDFIVSIWPENYPHQFYDQQESGDLATPVDTSDDNPDIINFTLDTGRSISGKTIDAEGLTVVNARVSVVSESTASHAYATTDDDGNFQIIGLSPANDFYLMAYETSMGKFYYVNDSSSSRNLENATAIDLSEDSIENISLVLSEGYAISGNVQSANGVLLENILVDAWSETLETGNSSFTDENGDFIINGLPSGMDYEVTARPDKALSYQPQSKTYVETDSSEIQFILSDLETYTLTGSVLDTSLSPVSGATLVICERNDLEDCVWDITDENGQYDISGLTSSSTYQLEVYPDIDSSISFLQIYPFVMTADTAFDITLSAGATISGTVLSSDNAAISNARVQVVSNSTGFFQETTTGIDGSYEFTQSPDVTDYEITASADGYIESSLTDQTASDDIDFSLEAGGTISGEVTDASSGEYIEGAIVEIYSYANHNAANYGGIAVTNSLGQYSVDQLKITDESGDTIADYVVTANATAYPAQTNSGIMTGDTVNLYMYAETDQSIGITITDASGLINEYVTVIASIFDDDGYYGRKSIDTLSGFQLTGLSSDKNYSLLFTAYSNSEEILSQWASTDGTGVFSQDQAGTFAVGDLLQFVFQPNLRRSLKNTNNAGPGPVRDLRSITHDYRHINKRLRSIDSSNTSTVSNDPNITVTWDAPDEGEDDLSGYYTDFNVEDSYSHSAFNTVTKPVIRTRKITSSDLEGDDVSYYFHVAAVDVEGRIGQTTSIAFRIDTIAPTNVNVTAPDSATDRNIALVLGATGASDVYISNINYEESGDWDNLSTEKEWKLSRGDGIKTIYVRFRDAAGNTSDTMTVTSYTELLENSGPMISDRTFTVSDSLTDGLYVGIVEATDADDDPLTFTISTGSMTEGFGLNSDSGLLFVDQANIFPETPGTYDLTVTVQDSEESSSAKVRVNVTAGNYPPEIANQSFSIDEHSPVSTPIAMLEAIDADGDTITFSIISGNSPEIFSLNSETGVLSVQSSTLLDYENQASIVLTIGASDSQITQTAQITINLNNINDNTPDIQSQSFIIDEQAENQSIIGQIVVSDADGQTPVCAINSGNDSNAFSLDEQSCELKVNDTSKLDYEQGVTSFVLNISASDGSLSNASPITVNIRNINDNPPEIESQNFTVMENTIEGIIVYTIAASDPDQLSALVYQFIKPDENLPFSLEQETGIIKVKSLIDYESQSTYTLTVQVFDNKYTAIAEIIISVLNENDNAPKIEDHQFYVSETIANKTIIGNLKASDADGDSLTYSLLINTDDFTILPETRLQIINNEIIDSHEQGGVFNLTVSVSDGLYTDSGIIHLSITPVNDHAPLIEDINLTISESTSPGTMISSIIATDEDQDLLTFSITAGNTNNSFTIAENSGQLFVDIKAQLDYETQSEYTLTIRVWDGAFDTNANVFVHISNSNDNPPETSDLNCTLLENTPQETPVCQVSGKDTDNDTLYFSIISETEAFMIEPLTGMIIVKNHLLLDYETIQAYTIQTAVTDNTYTVTQQTIIQLINENDNLPELTVLPIETLEDTPVNTCIQWSDADGDQLTLVFQTQGDYGILKQSEKNCLSYTPNSNVNGLDSLQLTAFDGLHTSDPKTLTITIIAVNDPPTLSPIENISIFEDTPSDLISIFVTDIDNTIDELNLDVLSDQISLIPNNKENIKTVQTDKGYSLQLIPVADQSGSSTLTVTVSDELTSVSTNFICTVIEQNDPPEISAFAAITINEDISSNAISFTISDNETNAEDLYVTVYSYNSNLIPNDNKYLALSGTDNLRQLIVNPLPDMFGISIIQVNVNDGSQSVSSLLTVTVLAVNDPPEINAIDDIQIDEDIAISPIILDISDKESPVSELNISIETDNFTLLPNSGLSIDFNSEKNTYALTIKPVANTSGNSQLTVTVSDGELSVSTAFQLTVNPVNDPPVISTIPNQTIAENTSTGPIQFTVTDLESHIDDLLISINSSNTDLIPINESHVLIANQNLTLTPVSFASGSTHITITVDDGHLQAHTSFLLQVTSVDQSPVISNISDQSFDEDTSMQPLALEIWDPETPIENLNVWAESSNISLFPVSSDNIKVNYHDNVYWIELTPAKNQFGTSTVTVYADDGFTVSYAAFDVNVLPVEDMPVLIPPLDIQIQEDSGFQSIAFQADDPETPANDLIITAISDNTALISQESIAITGTTNNKWLTLSVTPGNFGIANIYMTLADAAGNTQTHTQTITVLRGNTLAFNGENDYVEIMDHESIQINENLTVEAWIMPCTITSIDRTIVNKINAQKHGVSLSLISENYLQVIAGNNTQSWTLTSVRPVPGNVWTHVAASITTQGISIFINAKKDAELNESISLNLNQGSPLIFGGQSDNPTSASFCGQMDDIRLWKAARTENDISLYMNQRLQGDETSLAGYWHFKDSEANDYCSLNDDHYNHGIIHKDAPMLSMIPDQWINEDTDTENINFTVSDLQTQAENLIVKVQSSDGSLVSDSNIILSGTGKNRALQISPNANQWGSCNITVSVNDGETITSRTFLLTVLPINDPPYITMTDNISVLEDSIAQSIGFQLTDVDNLLDDLSISVNTSDSQILPLKNIMISKSGQWLSFTPTSQQSGSLQLSLTVSDGQLFDTAMLTISITPVNDIPIISNISDREILEDANEISIPFSIQDVETDADQLQLSIEYSPSNGDPFSSLYLSGTGTERYLHAVPASNQSGSLMITLTLSDDNQEPAKTFQSFLLKVLPVNDSPIMTKLDDLTIYEDAESVDIFITVQDIESESSALNITAISLNNALIPQNSIFITAMDMQRQIHFSPKANMSGMAGIEVILSDPDGKSVSSTFSVTVEAVNDTPIIQSTETITFNEDTPSAPITINVSDIETANEDLIVWAKSKNTHLINENGILLSTKTGYRELILSPIENKSGVAMIEIGVSDNEGLTQIFMLTCTVLAINDAPVIAEISDIIINEDTASEPIILSLTDLETQISDISIEAISDQNEILSIDDIQLTYEDSTYFLTITPKANIHGQSKLCLIAYDSEGLSDTTCFDVEILAVNDLPTISEISNIYVNEDSDIPPIEFFVSDIETPLEQLYIQVDISDKTLISIDDVPIQGKTEKRTLYISANENTSGSTWVSLTLNDFYGGIVSTKFLVDIAQINDAPTIENIKDITVIEDQAITPLTLSVKDIETPVENLIVDVFSNSEILPNSALNLYYNTEINAHVLTFSITPDTFGDTDITIQVSDPEGLSVSTAFQVHQLAVNDAPKIGEISDQTILEDSLSLAIPISITDVETSAQNMNLHVSLAFVNVVNYQDFSVSNDGKFIANFTTIPNAFGSDTITVMTSDAEGLTAIINFTINVLAVNDPPTIQAINDQGSDEDAILGPFPFFIDDIDNPKDSLIVKVSIHNSELSNYSQITNQTLTLIPEKDQHGSTDVLISVSDPDGLTSSTKFTWIVYPQKDSPIIADISNIIINEDTEKTSIPFSASHVDYNYNDLAFELLSDAPNIIDPEKQKIDESMLIITPEPDQFGIVQLCLVATDPNPLSAQSCFSVTIVSQNDPPVISASKDYTINEDNILNIPFFVEDIDSEIDISMINCSVDTNVAQVSKAILLADNFSISLTPDKDYFGNFNLEISVNDTQGGTDQIIVQILVQAVNDAPLAHPGEWTVFEDLSVTRQLTATDIDGDSLTYTISTAPQYGSIQLLDDHKVYYEPKPNFSGIDRFSFYVSDSLAISSPAWITLTIDDTPDTPVANAGSNLTVNELQEVKLDGYLSNDPDQDIISYQWQQTDGVLVSLTDTDQIAISFIAPDVTNDQDLSFEIFVTDKTGRSHKDSVVVHVLDLSPPTAGFQASSEEGLVPHEVQFTDTSVGKIDTWLWEFGDGYISREPHPMHIYSKSGEYTVILTVSGPNGSRTKERIDYIQAKAAELKAEFMATPINGVAPLTVNFSDLSEGEVEQMTWNFGDNNQSSTPSPVHTYEMPGEYTVTLTIYDAQSVDHIEKPFFISVSDRKIQGRITSNENSDQKLENYFVIAYGENFNIKTLSDINGNYTLTGLPAVNNIKLGVFPPANDDEFLSQFYNEKDSLNDADKLSTEESDLNNIDIYLKPMPSLKITGRVHNGYQGKEKLNVSVFSDEIQWGAENQTDMDGNYTLTGLKPATDYKLSVWWEEQNTLVYYALPSDGIVGQDIPTFSQFEENLSTTFEMTEQNLVHMDIILSMSNNTISGQLVNENGKGIANIWVNAWSSALETGNAALSDNQGHYTIMGLPPVSQDEVIDKGYQLTIQSNGYQAYPELVFVPSSGINFSLKTTTWISGKVISDNGEAIQSACIHLWSASDLLNNIYSSCTDDTGNYTVNGLSFASDYIVKVTAPNFPDYYYENTNDLNMASHLDLSTGPLTTVNFTLLSGGIITGQVFIESNDQKAFSGIWVNVWSPSADISRQVQTDNTGVFQFNSLDKSITDYYIMIQDSNYLPAFYCDTAENNTTTQKDLATPVKTNDQIYEIVLKSGLKVCGTITGGFDLSKEFQLTARSENFGIYQPTNIPAGDTPAFCIDHLTADYYNFSLYQGQQMILTQSMLVIANMNQLELSVAEQSLGKISGQVQGLPENVWAQIRVWSDSLQMEKNIRILGTGSSINYSIENLPRASDYAAVFSSDDLPDQYFDQTYHQSQAKVIDISKNDFDNTHFIIQENSGSIYGKIYFSNDLPIDGLIKIKAWSQSLGTVVQKNMQLSSANNIAYSLTKLEKATDYIVSVEADGYIYQYYSDSIKPALAQKLDLETETIKLDINFYLTKGVNLSGKVETTLSLEALTVEAENQIDGQIFSVPLSIDGNYNLQGLFADKNYLLWVRHDNGSRWYYADTQSLMNKDLAIWVTPSSLQSYDFVIQTNKSIAGNVKSSTGDPISGVWVEAKNVTGKISGGSYTADDGSYEIPFLMDQTYLVSANPDANSFFKSMEKSDIQAGTLSVNFILEKNSGAVLSGTVSNLQTSVESLARITVIDEQGKSIQTVSDRNGNYIINGLEIENKYYINVFPSSESNAAFLKTSVEISENNQTLDLELSAGVNMQGQVIDLASNKPIDEATVIYQSESTGYYNIIQTDESGGFELFSMPDTMDYDVRVISANHQSINLINQQPSQYRLFEMISSGSVVGTLIHNQSGNGIAGAVVHIQSATRGIERSALTHSNGEFILSGLIEKDEQGQAITDYVLTVIANQYPIKTFRNVQTGQERIIRLSQSQGKRIRARIKNTNDENWIVDIFKNQGDFVQTQVVQTNQWFECMGLDSSITYQLRITNISQTQQYWIGESGNLQDNRAQAESISIPSQVDIQAPENNTKRNIRKMFETFQSTLTAPEITSTSHGIFTPETPNVSSIPVIEMAWTLSSIENILGYYVVFNDQADFEWDKSNASGYHIIPLTGLNSPEFSGNETSVYCHIAAVDNMGDIGPTGHAGPYVIDTVSPENIYIIAPSTTPTRSIQINLHASDAQEIYLSTLGYDTGSSWQPYIQTLTFLLPAETGKHMIYASFRDRARNTSRSHTALLLESPENTMPIASSQTFNVIEDKTYSSKLTGYDENGDSLQYSIQNLPEHGTLTLLDSITGDFSYAPEKDYFGQDYFTFSVNDGATNSVASQCTLTIQNQNDEPQVFSSEFSVEQNSSYLGQLQAIDIDQDILTYEIFAKPAKGIVRLTNPQTGEFQYIPNTDTFGKDSFLFNVNDGEFTPQPEIVKVEIIPAATNNTWYSGWYPEGFIVDKNNIGLENILITFYGKENISYTTLTDENGYFVLETQKEAESNYALKASGKNIADIWISWPQDDPPQTYTLLSVLDSNTVLLTGTCKGSDGDIDALIIGTYDKKEVTVKSVSGMYTLAVGLEDLPVDLEVTSEGYETALFKGLNSGVDILLEKKVVNTQEDDFAYERGCFIGVLGY